MKTRDFFHYRYTIFVGAVPSVPTSFRGIGALIGSSYVGIHKGLTVAAIQLRLASVFIDLSHFLRRSQDFYDAHKKFRAVALS